VDENEFALDAREWHGVEAEHERGPQLGVLLLLDLFLEVEVSAH